jgi:uncharacterized protein YkwD
MNKLLLLLFAWLIGGMDATNISLPPDVSGTYVANSGDWTIYLKKEGNKVLGVVKDSENYMAAANGTWQGETLQLSWSFNENGLKIKGKGSMTFVADGNSFQGEFTQEISQTSAMSSSSSESSGGWQGKRTNKNGQLPPVKNQFEKLEEDTTLKPLDDTNNNNSPTENPTTETPPTPSAGEPANMQGMVEAHNFWRRQLGVPDLVWSAELAQYAQNWANELAKRGCDLEHRPSNGAWKQLYGENLYGSWGMKNTPKNAVDSWASERKDFNFNTLECNGSWFKCGHYTQIIWEKTTQVGCAMAKCGDKEIWVCNYNPAGNMMGEKPYKKK